MPTIEQIRAARALVGWSQGELAEQADLSQTGIARIENGTNKPNSQTLAKIQAAFDRADVEFIDTSGVRKRTGTVRTMRGAEGLYDLMNDLMAYAQTSGGKISLFNAKPVKWLEWIDEEWFYNVYSKTLADLGDKVDMRIIAVEGETELISKGHATYKMLPEQYFSDGNKCIYIYGGKIAFTTFYKGDVECIVLEGGEFAAGMSVLFEIAWERAELVGDK